MYRSTRIENLAIMMMNAHVSYQCLNRRHVKVMDQNFERQNDEKKNMRKDDGIYMSYHVWVNHFSSWAALYDCINTG